MENDINAKQREEKKTRAKRADIDAMQERFDAIVTVVETATEGTALTSLGLILRLANGNSLDEIINEAGRAALGLES